MNLEFHFAILLVPHLTILIYSNIAKFVIINTFYPLKAIDILCLHANRNSMDKKGSCS